MFHHNSQIDPIYKRGKADAAALLIHGFTGTPDCLRPLANHLHYLGFTVMAPLLAGHGTTREALAKTTWQDWYETVQTTFLELQEKHGHVYVAGLSLGALLTLKLAEDYPQALDAIACLSTPLYLNRWVNAFLPLVVHTPIRHVYQYQRKVDVDVKDPLAKKNFWNITEMPIRCIHSLTQLQKITRGNLAKIAAPTLLIHSRYDSTAPYDSMGIISNNISARVTETVTLENSFHLITLDYEKTLVSQKVGQFFLRFL